MTQDERPWLVVGLGNPGPGYARNRHNVGFMVVDQLAADLGLRLSRHRSRAQVAQSPGLILAEPTCYMNESGGQVAALLSYYGVGADRLLVAHDELDLDFAVVRLKHGGGEAGHNGLRSISKAIGSRDYGRIRIGIGRPPGRTSGADYVLRDFPAAQRPELEVAVAQAADAALRVVHEGMERARTVVNAG